MEANFAFLHFIRQIVFRQESEEKNIWQNEKSHLRVSPLFSWILFKFSFWNILLVWLVIQPDFQLVHLDIRFGDELWINSIPHSQSTVKWTLPEGNGGRFSRLDQFPFSFAVISFFGENQIFSFLQFIFVILILH